MIETTSFRINQEVVKSLYEQGRQILKAAERFDESWKRIGRKLSKLDFLEVWETMELLQTYTLIQTWNRVHAPETGRLLAQEVKRWQTTKVEVMRLQWVEKNLLETTPEMTAKFNAIHAWFGE
jgi:hypothetical protein